MDALAQRVLKALLSQGTSQERSLFEFLPSHLKHDLTTLPSQHIANKKELFHAEKELLSIHYSWLFPFFNEFSSVERCLYASILKEEQRKGLESMLKGTLTTTPLTPFSATYFTKRLFKRVTYGLAVPVTLLSNSKLSILLNLQKHQLVLLIDFLGLYDLAFEVRQILDKKVLDKITVALTKEQKVFLNYCQKQPQKWRPPKLNLSQWNGDAKTLNLLLHQRGLFRFSHAFTQDSYDLLRLFEFRLDSGRGQSIEKYFKVKVEESAVSTFYNQVLQLAERFNRHENH